jgi:RimJ/RimL family protein N-acetyltransferase
MTNIAFSYLKVEGKSALVLYVAHDNPAARSVYRRVGFRGLEDEAVAVAGVEPWLEIGFDRSVITLGHW